jgi:cobalt/nickel transport system ATP-binding protein
VTAPTLEVRALAFSYPDGTSALNGVDLLVHPGEKVALLGPNGAGKTTLLLHLNGILTPREGTVRIDGIPVTKEHLLEVRHRVGIVFQDPNDQVFMPTVAEDVAFGPANLGLSGEALETRVVSALGAVGLSEQRQRAPHHLSYGERRLVAIAGVLAMEPEILVLDEPTANLDPAGRRELAEILDGLRMTTLMVTHDLPYALQLCRRAVLMNKGRVVADGPIDRMLADTALMAANRLELPFGFDKEILGRGHPGGD